MMLSELGKEEELRTLLEYADSHLKPTWMDGGLYYPRNSQLMDDDWNYIHVEPHSGNSGIGYSRLNVANGQKTMWEKPWTKELLASRPYFDGDGFGDDVDFLRGIWDAEEFALIATVRRWKGEEARPLLLYAKNLAIGDWGIFINGHFSESRSVVESGGHIMIKTYLGTDESDIVVQKLKPS